MEYIFLKLIQTLKLIFKSTEWDGTFQTFVKASNVEVLNIKWVAISFVLLEIVLTILFVYYIEMYIEKNHNQIVIWNYSYRRLLSKRNFYNYFLAFSLLMFNSFILLNIYIFFSVLYYCISVTTIIGCPLIIIVLLYIYLNIFIVKQKTLRSAGGSVLFCDFELDWLEFPTFFVPSVKGYYIFYPAYKFMDSIGYILEPKNHYKVTMKDLGMLSCCPVFYPNNLKGKVKLILLLICLNVLSISIVIACFYMSKIIVHNIGYW